MKFKVFSTDGNARTGRITLNGKGLDTPALLPVATLACVRGLSSKDLRDVGVKGIICNTLHLHFFPGDLTVKSLGGLHSFMNYDGIIFTDSGGFQAFSLGAAKEHGVGKIAGFFPGEDFTPRKVSEGWVKITEKGIYFRNPLKGVKMLLTPEKSMEIQYNLGSDIAYVLDECTSPLASKDYTEKAMERTHRWALRCLNSEKRPKNLFGIVQGGEYKDLRERSARFLSELPFDGYGIGGSLGKTKSDMLKILEWVCPILPPEKPRHLLGIGGVEDVFESVERGIDLFDCVTPTRWARRGVLLISPEAGGKKENKFMLKIRPSKHSLDKRPLDTWCDCWVCQEHSRAYLRHLYKHEKLNFWHAASYHNICFMTKLMHEIRESIENGGFLELKKRWLELRL